MKKILIISAISALIIMAGCGGPVGLKTEKEILTVTFEQGQTLRYRFVSNRKIDIDWGQMGKKGKTTKNKTDKHRETFKMVVAYTAVEADAFGLTRIKAKCESVKTSRSPVKRRRRSREAAEYFDGKSFSFGFEPNGKIEDYSNLHQLIKKVGENAFRDDRQMGRIKSPDMIGDFIVTQWFLWDSISSIAEPIEGVAVGDSWSSKLPIPTPMIMRQARDVEYTLSEIRPSDEGRLAIIKSSYGHADSVPDGWAIPYTGSFQMKGTFGFLRGYKITELQGSGEEIFNIDAGRCEGYRQNYTMKVDAKFPLGLGIKPKLTVKQTITMELIKD